MVCVTAGSGRAGQHLQRVLGSGFTQFWRRRSQGLLEEGECRVEGCRAQTSSGRVADHDRASLAVEHVFVPCGGPRIGGHRAGWCRERGDFCVWCHFSYLISLKLKA